MKRNTILIASIFCLILSLPALAADFAAPPAAPSMPARPMGINTRAVIVGPKDDIDHARFFRGKFTIICVVPTDKQAAEVEVLLDGKSIGKAAGKPYKIDFDSTTVTDGDHIFKAIARDTDGKESWSAQTKVNIRNSSSDALPYNNTHKSPGTPAPAVNSDIKKEPAVPEKHSAPVETAAQLLDRTYISQTYGFSIRYPNNWTVKDETANIKPKQRGSVWVAFSGNPSTQDSLVVNVRRASLDKKTTADTFAKYNSYVMTWQKKTMLGSPAFATTTGTAASKRVIHRLIIIKDGYSWMLNCIDTTGKPEDASLSLFNSMVDSLQMVNSNKPVQIKETH